MKLFDHIFPHLLCSQSEENYTKVFFLLINTECSRTALLTVPIGERPWPNNWRQEKRVKSAATDKNAAETAIFYSCIGTFSHRKHCCRQVAMTPISSINPATRKWPTYNQTHSQLFSFLLLELTSIWSEIWVTTRTTRSRSIFSMYMLFSVAIVLGENLLISKLVHLGSRN